MTCINHSIAAWRYDDRNHRADAVPLSKATFDILVIDDDRDVLSSLRFLLESEGFNVVTFENGQDFFDNFTLPEQGCLIIDYRMPSMSGIDLLRELRAQHIDLPAVLITGYPNELFYRQAAELDAACVLLKPDLQRELVECVAKALARYRHSGRQN